MDLRPPPQYPLLHRSASVLALQQAERHCAAQLQMHGSIQQGPSAAVAGFVRMGAEQPPCTLGRRLLLQALAWPSPVCALLPVVQEAVHARCVAIDERYRQAWSCQSVRVEWQPQNAESILHTVAEGVCGNIASYLLGCGPEDQPLDGDDEEVIEFMRTIDVAWQLPAAAACWRQIRLLGADGDAATTASLDEDVCYAWRNRLVALCAADLPEN